MMKFNTSTEFHPKGASQWSYVKQEDFIYDMEIDSRGGLNEDEP